MGFICNILGHKWIGCKCERCGATRNEGHDLQHQNQFIQQCTVCKTKKIIQDVECEKCGKSLTSILQREEEKSKQNKAMGGGLFFDLSADGLMECPKCGKIACSKCGLELSGHDMKSCPFCKSDYEWDSYIG